MKSDTTTLAEYIQRLPSDRKRSINLLRKTIKDNLPEGFVETMNYGMIGFVVPLSLYPNGYLDNQNQPLPFINIASQKNHIALYHMGMYANKNLLDWFKKEYALTNKEKLDMGKSCLRFKNPKTIPFKLIGTLASKISVDEWIKTYEKERKKH